MPLSSWFARARSIRGKSEWENGAGNLGASFDINVAVSANVEERIRRARTLYASLMGAHATPKVVIASCSVTCAVCVLVCVQAVSDGESGLCR